MVNLHPYPIFKINFNSFPQINYEPIANNTYRYVIQYPHMSTKNFFVTLFFSVIAFFAVGGQMHAEAAASDNVFGEAWSNNTGWISFNNCVSPVSCSGTNYGVNMDNSTGNLSGAAWSDNIGWISFNATSGCPVVGCTTQPKVNLTTGAFTGWARAVTYGGGWDGWIALNATDVGQAGWGWQANMTTGNITGTAWGDLVNGWIASISMRIDLSGGGPAFAIIATSGANGSISPAGSVSVPVGNNITFNFTPNPGYRVNGVTVDGSPVAVAGSYTFTNVQADHTIHVTFIASSATYTITACGGMTGGNISPPGTTIVVTSGSKTYTISPNSGYITSTLTVDGVGVAVVPSYNFINVTANHTICATFTPSAATYTISASAGANGAVTPPGVTTVASGASQLYTITPNAGYSTATLTVDGNTEAVVSQYNFSSVQANHTIAATFIPTTPGGPYTITSSSGPNGMVTPVGAVSVPAGNSSTFNITPDAGYSISTLIVDGSPVPIAPSYRFNNVNSNHTIHATFMLGGPTGDPQCSDTIDNDGDGLIDYPLDPGCTSLLDNSEKNTNVIYIER